MGKRFRRQILTGLFSFIVFSTSAQSGVTVTTSQSTSGDSIIIKDSNNIQTEISATFMGGDINVFRDWVQRNVVYPPIAVEKGIFGRVYVMFSLDETGKLYHAEIYKGAHPLIDNEAIRVILSSPLWEPAKQNGKNVGQSFVMPVIFSLSGKFIKAHSK